MKTIKEIQSTFENGDVFRWKYKEGGKSYHCKSCIALCNDKGILFDNYWGYQPHKVDPEEVYLEFLGNLFDCEEVARACAYQYNRDDYIDLQNTNNSCNTIFLKKGAKPSNELILYKLEQDIKEFQHNIEYYKERMLTTKKEIADINKY